MKHILIACGIFSSILVSGCSNQDTLTNSSDPIPLSSNGYSQEASVTAQLSSAQLNIFVGFTNNQPVQLHRITKDWTPATITWNTFSSAFDPISAGSFIATSNGWQQVDITSLVNDWYDGTHLNFGIVLEQTSQSFFDLVLLSSEQAGSSPFIRLCFQSADGLVCDSVLLSTDLYIDESQADATFDGSNVIFVGNLFTIGNKKQSLLRFTLPQAPSEMLYSSIGGFAWDDLSPDGINSSEEPRLSGIAVNLYDCADLLHSSTITDASGSYLFDSLAGGSYKVELIAPADYLLSPMDQGIDDMIDSDADIVTGRTNCFVLGEGVDELSWSAGFYVPAILDTGEAACTRGIGYWKNHAGFGPQDDMVTPNIPIWLGNAGGEHSMYVDSDEMAVNVLSMKYYGAPKNGITKICAQLLAARMNIATGVPDVAVAAYVLDADSFIAAHHWSDWEDLESSEKESVSGWEEMLEMFNRGYLGAESCD